MRDVGDKVLGVAALGLSGAAAYAFLAVAGRSLGPSEFAPIGALWAVVFLLTSALAAPLEMVVARAVATARARGDSPRAAIRAGFVIAAIVGIATLTLAVPTSGWFDQAVFSGQTGFTVAAAIAFAGLTVGAVAKGGCAGGDRLAGWGSYLLVDGGVRLAVGVVAAAAAPQPLSFAAALALGPWVALAAPAVPLRRLISGFGSRVGGNSIIELMRSILPLILAAFAAAAVIYAGSVMLPILQPSPNPRVGAMIGALSLARLPLFAFSPLVAIALPKIAYAIEAGNPTGARRNAAALIGFATIIGVFVLSLFIIGGNGPLSWLFGPGFTIPAESLSAVGVAAAGWLVATAATAVGIAAGAGGLAAAAWTCGLIVTVLAAAFSGPDTFGRTDAAIALGGLAAGIAAVVSAAAGLGRRLQVLAMGASS